MKNLLNVKTFFSVLLLVLTISSCTTVHKSMREPNVLVDLKKSDFTLSDQVTAEASSTKIIGIDFERIFMKTTGSIERSSVGISLASLPVIGELMSDNTANYALYELMNENPGYDVIFYPQYEVKVVKPIIGIGFIMKTTTVKTTARLGKLND